MTRKRFIKLLMAETVSRNAANKLADETISCGDSHIDGYWSFQIDKALSMINMISQVSSTQYWRY